ncbi:MAG: site-2 protease family protein [Deltaproteobacteria bacterium]|nr:site-2 protease family protein [Deltaproteobacteria bacterium]
MVPFLLFLATFVTTLLAGAYLAGGNPLARISDLVPGLMFNLPLLAILGIHEMGHYAAARRHRVVTTPPYFIPFLPIPPLPGTMGAVIKLKSPFPDRNALMDIGFAGPLAGAIVAIPVLAAGLALSEIRGTTGALGSTLGESLLFKLLSWIVLGEVPAGHDVILHPMGYAGWLGLYVTMLNLIPAGQLDGGHIAYALFGDRYGRVARLVPFALLLMGILASGWFVWAALLFYIGTAHPRPVFEEVPLTPARRAAGAIAAILFVLCFVPDPFPIGRG